MNERSTFPMSALFLLVTLVGVLLAMAFSVSRPRPATTADSPWASYRRQAPSIGGTAEDDGLGSLMAGAFCGGILGPIVMAYQSWKWKGLVSSAFVGAAVGAAAIHYLVNSSGIGVALAGAAVLLIYGLVVRFAHVLPQGREAD